MAKLTDLINSLSDKVELPNIKDDNVAKLHLDTTDVDKNPVTEQINSVSPQDQRFTIDTKLRIALAIWSAIVVSCWLKAVFYILINNNTNICLSDTVLVTLLGTTTLNILGLSYIVLKGMFNSDGKPPTP